MKSFSVTPSLVKNTIKLIKKELSSVAQPIMKFGLIFVPCQLRHFDFILKNKND